MAKIPHALFRACQARFTHTVLAVGVSFGAIGCGASQPKPPQNTLKQARHDAEMQREFEKYERRHVAPPPAYGNKVVLAQKKGSPLHF